jgi:transcriptional regulator with XRE-family HTH domain
MWDQPAMTKPPIHLATIRKLRRLSQRDLAAMIGMDAATVQRAEVGHTSAKLETYISCADALGVTLADIFAEGMGPVERELLNAFRAMSPERREKVQSLLELVAEPQQLADQ